MKLCSVGMCRGQSSVVATTLKQCGHGTSTGTSITKYVTELSEHVQLP